MRAARAAALASTGAKRAGLECADHGIGNHVWRRCREFHSSSILVAIRSVRHEDPQLDTLRSV
jgi:hypothetical protein